MPRLWLRAIPIRAVPPVVRWWRGGESNSKLVTTTDKSSRICLLCGGMLIVLGERDLCHVRGHVGLWVDVRVARGFWGVGTGLIDVLMFTVHSRCVVKRRADPDTDIAIMDTAQAL